MHTSIGLYPTQAGCPPTQHNTRPGGPGCIPQLVSTPHRQGVHPHSITPGREDRGAYLNWSLPHTPVQLGWLFQEYKTSTDTAGWIFRSTRLLLTQLGWLFQNTRHLLTQLGWLFPEYKTSTDIAWLAVPRVQDIY